MANDEKLRIIIVGSGLSGLAAARVLREKHEVIVYERGGPAAATGGQGICIFPSAVKILRALGFDTDRVGSVWQTGQRKYDKNGNFKADIPFDYEGRYGAPAYSQKRSDFRDELLRLATTPSEVLNIGAQPARMIFNKTVVDVDPEQGKITLEDGSIDEADVIIAADGVHSKLRNRVVGEEYRVKKAGLTCYRIALAAEDVKKAFGKVPEWWHDGSDKGPTALFEAEDRTNRFLIAYPMRHGLYMNISCIFPSGKDRENVENSWYADGDRNAVIEAFQDYSPELKKLISISTEVKMWDLQDIDILPTWTKGRVLLIGDAAHAMTPLQAQGANQAIEDADALSLLLEPGLTKDKVPTVLQKIDSLRRPRVAQIQTQTRNATKKITWEEKMSNTDFQYGYQGIYESMRN